ANVDASLLMDNAQVEDHASVIDSILGVGSVVEAGARLERCVLGDGVRVAQGEHLVDVRRAA
ncbi:MAG: NDP-sugar synthase, partial [Candidatus Poseidoniaceae archaeon]